jgi:D-xylose 1-dehydrogenase (NADP+, D-xylono-1,5-lactone-forming)
MYTPRVPGEEKERRDRVRWGILGCGSIAQAAIAPAMRWSKTGELRAVASRTDESAKECARLVEAEISYGSYEKLLADPEIDAVYIGVPNGEHARWAVAAAEAGKHVLCDKSLALTVEDARSMQKAFRKRSLRLVEGFMVRHHPQWALLRELLDAKAIGTVRHVRSWFRATLDAADDHRWSKALGGGALFDVGCYPINAARFVFQTEPLRAQATASWKVPGVDISVDALLDFSGGGVASIHGSLRAPFEEGLVVSGDRGRIVLERPFVSHWDPVDVILERTAGREVRHVPGANHFLHMVEHVERCILDPDCDLAPAEDGSANVAACILVRQASERY